MPNIFQRAWSRLTGRGQAEAPAPQPQAPESQPEREERRGFFTRIRDRVTGEDRRREELEQERQEQGRIAQERAEIERQRQELAAQRAEIERQRRELEFQRAYEADRQAQRDRAERLNRERIEAESARRIAERERQQERRQPAAAGPLAGIPPILPLGPKGRDGASYTSEFGSEIMRRLGEASDLGKRVSLRVHDKNGWHDLFLNPDGPGRHKAARGISAEYLRQQIGDDFDAWVGEGCDTEDGGYEVELEEPDGYQLTVWS